VRAAHSQIPPTGSPALHVQQCWGYNGHRRVTAVTQRSAPGHGRRLAGRPDQLAAEDYLGEQGRLFLVVIIVPVVELIIVLPELRSCFGVEPATVQAGCCPWLRGLPHSRLRALFRFRFAVVPRMASGPVVSVTGPAEPAGQVRGEVAARCTPLPPRRRGHYLPRSRLQAALPRHYPVTATDETKWAGAERIKYGYSYSYGAGQARNTRHGPSNRKHIKDE
jgi:hypothetical protein